MNESYLGFAVLVHFYTHMIESLFNFSLGLRILVLKQWVYLVEMHEIGKKYFENLKFNESQQNNKTEIALLFWKSGFLSDI